MSFEKLKLNKQLINALSATGITVPRDIQLKTIKRIHGGQDLIIYGPEGVGKTTTLVMGVVHRLKYGQEEPPRALILVKDKERISSMLEIFEGLSAKTGLKCLGLAPGAGMEGQKDDLAEGADIVIGTPDRVQQIYYKSGLNINKLQMFVLDDADLLIKQGFQTPIIQLAESLPKCQHISFSEVYHQKLENMLEHFIKTPALIEIQHLPEKSISIIQQMLYRVPNYKTKLNLLNLLMQDYELFDKVLVLCHNNQTVEKLYKSMDRRITGQVIIYQGKDSYYQNTDSLHQFMESEMLRVLVSTFENAHELNPDYIPFILFFEIPEDQDFFISFIEEKEASEINRASILFSTDLELTQVIKLEQATGHKFPVEDLPYGLIIEGTPGDKKENENEEGEVSLRGNAFHEKKAKNLKDYNYSYKDKLKMFGKKHRGKKKY